MGSELIEFLEKHEGENIYVSFEIHRNAPYWDENWVKIRMMRFDSAIVARIYMRDYLKEYLGVILNLMYEEFEKGE